MKVFSAYGSERRELVQPVAGWDASKALLNGIPRKGTWEPFRVTVIKENQGRSLVHSSCPWFCAGYAYVFREDVIIKLGSILSTWGEILPLVSDDGPL